MIATNKMGTNDPKLNPNRKLLKTVELNNSIDSQSNLKGFLESSIEGKSWT
jgi:hypothetical protein